MHNDVSLAGASYKNLSVPRVQCGVQLLSVLMSLVVDHGTVKNPGSEPGCLSSASPSSISGKPVTSSTFFTGTPIFSIAVAVPPVEIISKPRPARPCGRENR